MADTTRAIPDIPLDADPAVRPVLEALKENMEIREGVRGDDSSNGATQADITDRKNDHDTLNELVSNLSVAVTQIQTVRDATKTTYSAPGSGDGTKITELDLDITPKNKDSKIVLIWNVFFEMQNDTVFIVHKDGVIMPDSYNDTDGNVNDSGIATNYDGNDDSTPSVITIMIFDLPDTLSEVTYSLAVRSSNTTARTFYFNRAINNSSEVGVSFGMALEVAP